jgi:hypothetical protein
MHPTLVAQPFHYEGWIYEEKVDGYRVLAYKAGETVRLMSRHATFELGSGSYGWHGTGRITLRIIAGVAATTSAGAALLATL